jgi:hypothetical protein
MKLTISTYTTTMDLKMGDEVHIVIERETPATFVLIEEVKDCCIATKFYGLRGMDERYRLCEKKHKKMVK